MTDILSLAEDGEVHKIRILLDKTPALVSATHKTHGWTSLHRAAQFGHSGVVKLLLESGSSIDAVDRNHNTALHAAASGHLFSLTCMALLVRGGATIEIRNEYGESPLFVAVMSSNWPGFLFLAGAGSDLSIRNLDGWSLQDMASYQLEGVPRGYAYRQQRKELRSILSFLKSVE